MNAKSTWAMAAAWALALAALAALAAPAALGRDWYVSARRGSGKAGTADKPAKDLGNIVSLLADGDRVFIAEGTYLGRGADGCDQIDRAVEIYGGFADDFSARDPWGRHRTILSGSNTTKNWVQGFRLSIDLGKRRDLKARHRVVVDGLIVDHGARNRYADKSEAKIVRKADPKTGRNPTPEYGGLSVAVTKLGDIEVRNCVVLNTASTGNGAIAVWGSEASRVTVANNIVCNNTGFGFYLHSAFYPDEVERMPQFDFNHNVAAFTSKPEPGSTAGGSALKVDAPTRVRAEWNVLAFSDGFGVDNAARARKFVLDNNLFSLNRAGDYLEFDSKMGVADLADEADKLEQADGNQAAGKLTLKVSPEWSAKYLSRQVVDRNAAEADIQAAHTAANELRSILGLPQEAAPAGEYSDAWLPRMAPDDALACGAKRTMEKYGSADPGQSGPIK